jgi:hypothetical protein
MRLRYVAALALALPVSALQGQDLLFANLASRVHTVVYDVPGLPSEQARFLAGAMKQKFPQAEILDAASATEPDLRAKLTRTFLLLTSFDGKSNLLSLTAQPLPLRIDGGVVRWGDFSAPAQASRVDFVGRNPYGVGYSVVSAFGSAALLMQGGDSGQYSYCIRNADGVLRKGTYDDEFTPTARGRLKLADARSDLTQFFATLERIHADPFARVTEQAYRRMKDDAFADLAAHAGKDGTVSIEDLAYIVRFGAAFIRDGHTESRWGADPGEEPIGHSRFPPFRFEYESGRFYITGATEPSMVGAELLSVNGAPTAQFLSPTLDRIAGETLTWRATRLADNQQFFLWFSNVVGKTQGCCNLRLRRDNGAEFDRIVEPVNLAQYRKIQPVTGRKLPVHNRTEVRFFDSGGMAQFIYPGFHFNPAEVQKVADLFRQIRDSKTADVIVDLRGNGGGEVQMGSLIFSHLTPKPVEQFHSGRIKISREALSYLTGEMVYEHEGEMLTVTDTTDLAKALSRAFAVSIQVPKQPEPFTGRIWLLVDHRTFSAANLFTLSFQKAKLGTIMGYETGQPADICGDPLLQFTLRHSGIPYQVAASANFLEKPQPGADEHGILPDVLFDRKLLAPYRDTPDPELSFALDYIRKGRLH